ncbi:ATP-binding protein [Candidatus Laterigemmans baculatus]|nr:anti-sigma regulatory factor [Candidatus Laterigemmans baculatus]
MRTLIVPSDLSSLDLVADLVLEEAREAGLDQRETYQLRLAVDEILTNIINYGYLANGLSGQIHVHAERYDESLVITLEDTSPPYDPCQRDTARVAEDFDKPLEERQIGGLGIYFALQAVSEFRYEYRDGRNRNIFIMRRSRLTSSTTSDQQDVVHS